jgi:hypothetical protein
MKITFEIDDNKIPEPFRDRPDVIFAFLHDNLYAHTFAKAEDNTIHKEYRKAFYNERKLDGDKWVEGIEEQDNAKIMFAKLLLDSVQMEQAKSEVLAPVATWMIMGSVKGKGSEMIDLYYSNINGYAYEGFESGNLPSHIKNECEAVAYMETNIIDKIRVDKIIRRMNDKSARLVMQWTNAKSKVLLSLRESNTKYVYDGYGCSGNLHKIANDELAIEYVEQNVVAEMSKKRKIKIRRAAKCAGKTL